MKIKDFIKKCMGFYKNGYKEYHLSIIVISFLIRLIIFLKSSSSIEIDNYINILNSIGLLTGFFFVSIDKIDFKYIDKNYKEEVKIFSVLNLIRGKEVTVPESTAIKSTIFSIIISIFLLICLQYILILFNTFYTLLLIITVLYILWGFIYSIVLWEFFTADKADKDS